MEKQFLNTRVTKRVTETVTEKSEILQLILAEQVQQPSTNGRLSDVSCNCFEPRMSYFIFVTS